MRRTYFSKKVMTLKKSSLLPLTLIISILNCQLTTANETKINPPLLEINDFSRISIIKKSVEYCHKFNLSKRQCAYVLATIEHESNFKSVKEAYWLSEAWRNKNLWYSPYYGRGFVQLTHKFNYEKYGKLLNLPLVQKPDLALQPNISLWTTFHGMKLGIFTGRKLDDYINKNKTDYYNARKIVNGLDKAAKIANRAKFWERQLTVY